MDGDSKESWIVRKDNYGSINDDNFDTSCQSIIEFQVGPSCFKLYGQSLFLSAASPVLRRYISEFPDVPIKRKDIDVEIFKIFLEFLHSDTFICKESFVSQLLRLAMDYDVLQLKIQCRDYAVKTLNIDTCVEYHNLGVTYDILSLQKRAFDFMTKEAAKLTCHSSFLKLKPYVLSRLIGSEDFVVDELQLFQRVRLWVIEECKRLGLAYEKPELFNRIRAGVFKHIRFPLIPARDFKKFVEPLNILTGEELAEIKLHHRTPMSLWPTLPKGRFNNRHRVFRQFFSIPLYKASAFLSYAESATTSMESTVKDYIKFFCSDDIILVGVEIYGPSPSKCNLYPVGDGTSFLTSYRIQYCVQDDADMKHWRYSSVITEEITKRNMQIMFPSQYTIKRNKSYTVSVHLKGKIIQQGINPLSSSGIVLSPKGDMVNIIFASRECFQIDDSTAAISYGSNGIIKSLIFKLHY